MPSTLIHLGVQGFSSRALVRDIDLRLVYLACVIPDIPWIVQRLINAMPLAVNRGELMLWSGVQSSLLFCLVFSAALALLMQRSVVAFAVLGSGCLVHLLLDITQIKWGRGAFFLAPATWQPISLDWLWPEHPLFSLLAFASLAFVLFTWRSIARHQGLFRPLAPPRLALAGLLVVLYTFSPGLMTGHLLAEDVYFSKTLAECEARAGKAIAFDRSRLLIDQQGKPLVELFTGEIVQLEGVAGVEGALISAKGTFTTAATIAVDHYHLHPPYTRITGSLVGLLLVCFAVGLGFSAAAGKPGLR